MDTDERRANEGEGVQGIGPGTVLGGRYSAQRRLAQMGTSERWTAHDVTLERDVTVLVFPSWAPHAEPTLDAGRRAAALEFDRLVRVLDVGTSGEVSYVVEEAVPGAVPYVALLRHGGLPAEEVRRIVGEVATCLDACGHRGLHHLNLSPQHVLRAGDGGIRLQGLATAAALRGNDHLESAAAARRDAVGVVALTYAGLTGRWPLPEGGAGLARAPQIVGGVVAPSEIAAGVPGDLDALCRLTLNEDQGPLSPGDFASQIAPWSARPIGGALLPRSGSDLIQPGGSDRGSDRGSARGRDGWSPAWSTGAPGSRRELPGRPVRPALPSGAGTFPAGTSQPAAALEAGGWPTAGSVAGASAAERSLPPGTREYDHSRQLGRAEELTQIGAAPAVTPDTDHPDAREAASRAAATDGRRARHEQAAGPTAAELPAGRDEHGAAAAVPAPGIPVLPHAAHGPVGLRGPVTGSDPEADPEAGTEAGTQAGTAEGTPTVTAAVGSAVGAAGQVLGAAGQAVSSAVGIGANAATTAVGQAVDTVGTRLGTYALEAGERATVRREARARAQASAASRQVPIDAALAPAAVGLEPPAPLLPPSTGATPTRAQARFVLKIVAGFVAAGLLLGVWGVSQIGDGSEISLPDLPATTRTVVVTPQPSPTEGGDTPTEEPTDAGPQELAVLSATGYDPEGDGSERNSEAGRVYDDDPDTFWSSEGYFQNLGALKNGVGVLVDMGQVVKPTSVTLILPDRADVAVYLGEERSREGAKVIGELSGAEGSRTIDVPKGSAGQYLIIWFTNISQVSDGKFRATLAEVRVKG